MASSDKDKKTTRKKKTPSKKTSKTGTSRSKSTAKTKKSSSSASAAKKTSSGTSKSKKTTKTKKTTTTAAKTGRKTRSSSGTSKPKAAAKSQEKKTAAKASAKKQTAKQTVAAKPAGKAARPEKKASRKRAGHKVGTRVLALLTALICYSAVILTGAFFLNELIVKPEEFPKNTVVNGVDVSGLTIKKAKAKLTKSWNKHTLSILEYGGTQIGEIKELDLKYDIEDNLEKVLRPGAVDAFTRFFTGRGASSVIAMQPKGATKKFNRQFNDLSIIKNAEGERKSQNAYIDMSNTDFEIVKEVYGDTVDTKLVKQAMLNTIADGENTFEYRRSLYYKTPEITSTTKSLLDKRDYCVKNLSFKIDYNSPINKYRITPKWLDMMMKVEDNGEVTLNSGQINRFVTEVVSPKFSSTGATRRLRSAGGGMYTVRGGTYGYTIDVPKEIKKLRKELKAGNNVERSPIYAGKTPKAGAKNDIGDDFVEISIARQMVWVVRKGKVKVKTPVVTGNIYDGHATPTGTYYIVYKDTNTVLRGRNNDGSEYESPVSYWAPFYLGYGLHDASWRGVFGGTIYRGNGSHGCVNCPVPVMPKIFANIYEGMPVIVH